MQPLGMTKFPTVAGGLTKIKQHKRLQKQTRRTSASGKLLHAHTHARTHTRDDVIGLTRLGWYVGHYGLLTPQILSNMLMSPPPATMAVVVGGVLKRFSGGTDKLAVRRCGDIFKVIGICSVLCLQTLCLYRDHNPVENGFAAE